MNESVIKSIVGIFIKKTAEEINDNTVINNLGSVLLPRMYAELKNVNCAINNYSNIKTFGDLLRALREGESKIEALKENELSTTKKNTNETIGIAVDIESIDNFPIVPDYRTDNFYKSVFSEKEISYCSIRKNPRESFAGKFTAKESLIKLNNSLSSIPLNQIEILNDESGRPFYDGFSLSISHSNGLAVGIAMNKNINFGNPPERETQNFELYVKKEEINELKQSLNRMKIGLWGLVIIMIGVFLVMLKIIR